MIPHLGDCLRHAGEMITPTRHRNPFENDCERSHAPIIPIMGRRDETMENDLAENDGARSMASRSRDDDDAKAAAQLLMESPPSVTASLTEADLRAAGIDVSAGPRLSLPKVLSWMHVSGGGGAAAAEQADTRPLPPIGRARLPRVASWRDVLELTSSSSSRLLELGSSSSSRLRELGETYLPPRYLSASHPPTPRLLYLLGETYLPSSSHRLRELVVSSSSSRLRELGETCLLFGRASAGRSFSRAVSFCRPVSLPSGLAELGAQHAKAAASLPRAGLYAAHEALLDLEP